MSSYEKMHERSTKLLEITLRKIMVKFQKIILDLVKGSKKLTLYVAMFIMIGLMVFLVLKR